MASLPLITPSDCAVVLVERSISDGSGQSARDGGFAQV